MKNLGDSKKGKKTRVEKVEVSDVPTNLLERPGVDLEQVKMLQEIQRRGRGRPKGSKNKNKEIKKEMEDFDEKQTVKTLKKKEKSGKKTEEVISPSIIYLNQNAPSTLPVNNEGVEYNDFHGANLPAGNFVPSQPMPISRVPPAEFRMFDVDDNLDNHLFTSVSPSGHEIKKRRAEKRVRSPVPIQGVHPYASLQVMVNIPKF